MSNRQLAKELGVSHTIVNRKKKLGQLTQTHSAEAARAEIEANTRPKADSPFGGGQADDPFRKAAAMERLQRARLLKLKADAAERNSFNREEVQQITTDLVIALREHILNMVSQRSDQMAAELGVDVAKLKPILRMHLSKHMTDGIRAMQGGAAA